MTSNRDINDALRMALSYNRPQLDEINKAVAEVNAHRSKVDASTIFLADVQMASFASEYAKALINQISRFNENLDAEHEVGLQLVTFGQSITFHVLDIGYQNPSLIIFTGLTEQKEKVELVQHVSQISFLLMGLTKLEPGKPKRKIGFIQEDTQDKTA